ncbi:hypothetical protein ACZ90_26145 [Streptomyces albus subsp. albus]|nr:hypothetical protein ACZ90_26145 [Streptomyces albus subsp. albus]
MTGVLYREPDDLRRALGPCAREERRAATAPGATGATVAGGGDGTVAGAPDGAAGGAARFAGRGR